MFDIVVVGGGPAGLATAIAARTRGLSALVLDARRAPIDKACGEGLMPGGVTALARLGIAAAALHGRPYRGIRFINADRAGQACAAEGPFLGGPGYGVRRTVLHEALVARAEHCGAELRWGTRARGLNTAGVVTDDGTIAARYVVGADGLHSRVRAWAGLAGVATRRARFGVRRHFRIAPWSDCVEVHWLPGCEAYVTPVAADEVGVAFLSGQGDARFGELLGRFATLRDRFRQAAPVSSVCGAGPFHQRVRGVAANHVALVGDASGYLDAITGDGLSLAFREAEAAVDAIAAGDLRRYPPAHRRIVRGYWASTSLLLFAQRRPWLRRRVVDLFSASPTLLSRLIAIHAGPNLGSAPSVAADYLP